MAIRVRVLIKNPNTNIQIETSALVNSGYETHMPEIHIPLPLVRRLGFSIEEFSIGTITLCGQIEIPTRILGVVSVKVKVQNKETTWVNAIATSIGRENEVLLSDKLTDALGISPIKVGEGLWRLFDDSPNIVRRSVRPEYWE